MTNELLAAARELKIPGSGPAQVLPPDDGARLAREHHLPVWEVEARALDVGVIPLHYLRNLARFGQAGQTRLLRSRVDLVATGEVRAAAASLLAAAGVGRLRLRTPVAWKPAGAEDPAECREVRRSNAGIEVEQLPLSLGTGDPSSSLRGISVVAACLNESRAEQLLQFACRMAGVPLVLAGVEGTAGQATTVLPGDSGVALLYKPNHPHLAPSRPPNPTDERATRMVAAWITEQTTRLITGAGELLRSRILYADPFEGVMGEFELK